MFRWFDTREADTFAKAVADDLAGRIPVPMGEHQKKITPERLGNAYEAIVARASAFGRVQKPSWYKKAHLGNTFRWALLEKGYDKEFVDTWTHNLLVAISSTKRGAE